MSMSELKFPIDPARHTSFRTICEVLRELYRDAELRADHVSMSRLNECHDMAKRMQRKLEEYKPGISWNWIVGNNS
jgi:hypothetical protein